MNIGQPVRIARTGAVGTVTSIGSQLSEGFQRITVRVGPSYFDTISVYAWELEK